MRISTFSSDKAAFSITAGTEATAEGQSKVLYSESSFQSSLFKGSDNPLYADGERHLLPRPA